MHDYLVELLKSGGYERKYEELNLWGNSYEFFIIQDYSIKDFKKFFRSYKTNRLIGQFQELDDDGIKKNTSLYVLVRVDSVAAFYQSNLNTIMQIEEDEYYFRKFVILYTESGLRLINHQNPLEEIIRLINTEDKFSQFEKDMFFDESYFIAMQLMVKLPFLTLPQEDGAFVSIENKIQNRIREQNLDETETKVEKILDSLDNISWTEVETKIDALNNILEGLTIEN